MTREEAITYLKVIWNRYKDEYEIERETLDAYHMAIEALTNVQNMHRGECASCKRSSDYCCKTDEDKTRCPIEEHYALPKNGYCHLYEQI